METSRFWLFLGLGVTAMLSLKYVASPDMGDPLSRFKLGGFHSGIDVDDGAVDARRLHAHGGGETRHELRPSLAGLESSMRKTTSAAMVTTPTAAKKVEAKKDDKKKTAAKKKTTTKKDDVNAGQFKIPGQDETPQAAATPAFNSAPLATGAPAQSTSYSSTAPAATSSAAAENPKNMSLHDWEDALITNPSYAETAKFIQAYQAKSVTADIFYAIVKEMLASKTAVLNQYGVLCLQMTPSVTSLAMLVEISSTDSKITSSVTTAESAYTALSYLGVLQTSLTTLTSASDLTAVLKLVSQSVTKNLSPTAATGTGATAQGGVAATTKTAYTSLAANLTKLQSKATDASVQEAMNSVLTTLAGLGITAGTSVTPASALAEVNRTDSSWR